MRLITTILLSALLVPHLFSEDLQIEQIGLSVSFPNGSDWKSVERMDQSPTLTVWRKVRQDGDTLSVIMWKKESGTWTSTNAIFDMRKNFSRGSEILEEEWTYINAHPAYRIVTSPQNLNTKPYIVMQYLATERWMIALAHLSNDPNPERSETYTTFCKTLNFQKAPDLLAPRLPSPVTLNGKPLKRALVTANIDFPEDKIQTVIRNAADLFEENLVFPRELPNNQVSIKLRNASFDDILELALRNSEFVHVRARNVVWIVKAGDQQAEIARLHDEIQRHEDDELKYRKVIQLLLQTRNTPDGSGVNNELSDSLSDKNTTAAKLLDIIEKHHEK